MSGERLVDVVNANSAEKVPSSILEFAQQAYAKEAPILIADGMPEQSPLPPVERQPSQPTEPSYSETIPPPQPQIDRRVSVPGYGCQPGVVPPSYYYYQPGSMYCRRQYMPVMPVYGHPRDSRHAFRNPENPVVQATEKTALLLNQYPLWDMYPSEVSRRDPSACFLNAILQKVIGRQTMGNTVVDIAANLDNYSSTTNHFYKHALGQEVPGDIIIAYPVGGARPEGAVYLGNGRVASYNPENGRVTTTDSIKTFYPPADPKQTLFNKVVLYRWASW